MYDFILTYSGHGHTSTTTNRLPFSNNINFFTGVTFNQSLTCSFLPLSIPVTHPSQKSLNKIYLLIKYHSVKSTIFNTYYYTIIIFEPFSRKQELTYFVGPYKLYIKI